MKKRSPCFLFIGFLLMTLTALPQVKEGMVDLRDFDTQKAHSLDGDYYFYWKQLLSPEAISPTEQLFQFPALWNGQVMDGDTLEATGYATYVATVLLDTSIQYTMHVEDMYTAFTIYFNGQVIAKNGVVADRQEDYMPCWKPAFVPITLVQDTNQLVIQVANFTHSKGGALEGLEIGERQSMADKELELVAYDLLLTGSLIMGGLFFLGLYFFGRHDKSILFFSLFCIVYSYRIAGFGYYTLHSLVDLPWSVTTRLEYITLFLSVFLFGRFVHNLYPTEARKIIWDFIGGLSLLFIAITLITPPTIYTLLVEPFFVILLAYIVLTLVIYVRAKIHKRPGSGFALFSTAIVFVVFAYNILVYFGWLDEWMAASFWGYILFFFSQSLILSYRFAYFLKNAKDDALKAAQAKSDFLSTISHEIRTPLNAVVGMSHYLLQDKPGDHQIQNLTSLRYSAQHLTALINDILDYNKLESGTVSFEEQATELPDLLHGIQLAYQPKAVEKGLNLFLEVDANLDEAVYVDRTRLSQVLNNLIDNAIKFTRQGTVTVKATKVDQDLGKVRVLFEVEDTGIGIPKDKEKIIFERFMQASSSTTREFGGTGLGLAIIKKLLELQGSRIDLRSVEGEGSVFSFTQWYKTGKVKQTSTNHQPTQKDIKSLKGKKVLLVEDNPTNVMVAEKFLSYWQMSMEVAENGAEGLTMAQENVYDVILMDLQMPVMDGYEASREIRTAGITTPIIALTASALLQVKEKVLMAGMNDYLTKPFDPEELKRKLLKNIH